MLTGQETSHDWNNLEQRIESKTPTDFSLVDLRANERPSCSFQPIRKQHEICSYISVLHTFSHNLPFGWLTHDSFHQLLKEVKPLATALRFILALLWLLLIGGCLW